MKVNRVMEIDTSSFQIGDQISVGCYTATCQRVMVKGSIFLMDQYLNKTYKMNFEDTNEGGYEKSDLRETLKSKEILDIFKDIRNCMIPFSNGDLIRIPFASELFGDKLPEWCEPDGHKQWPLMQKRYNRQASRCGEYEWSWLQNRDKSYSTDFCIVDGLGCISNWDASRFLKVRPVFLIMSPYYTVKLNKEKGNNNDVF